jgi:hypothetical protein
MYSKIAVLTVICLLLCLSPVVIMADEAVLQTVVDKDGRPGFVLILSECPAGLVVDVEVNRGTSLVEKFSGESGVNGYRETFYFNRSMQSGEYQFVIYVAGQQTHIFSRYIEWSLSSGAQSGNQGRLTVRTDREVYVVGDTAYVTVTLTGIDQRASGDVLFRVEGLGVGTRTKYAPIMNRRASEILSVVLTSTDCVKLDIFAAWGADGHTASVSVPIYVSAGGTNGTLLSGSAVVGLSPHALTPSIPTASTQITSQTTIRPIIVNGKEILPQTSDTNRMPAVMSGTLIVAIVVFGFLIWFGKLRKRVRVDNKR